MTHAEQGRADVPESTEENFRLLVESVVDYAIFTLDPTGVVTSWNLGAERIKGYRADEIIGRHFSTFYPEDAIARDHPRYELEVATREGRYREEAWRIRKDGTRFWADVTITALRDARGRLRGFAKVTRDMTERMLAEAAIREANASLERKVRERTAALELANKELEAFSYSVSHDLRAPLRGIDGFSKIVLESHGAALGAQGRRYLERVRAATQRMARLIDDMLALSRLTREEMVVAPVDLGALAIEVLAELRAIDPARSVEAVVARPAPAQGDARLLRALLANLLGNAWKFTSRKTDGPARIEFGYVDAGGETRYFVRDDGAGFDMTYADKLFTPFQRLHDASEFEGSGIGLAIVQRVVARHGGRAWAEGREGAGATFWFTLGEAV